MHNLILLVLNYLYLVTLMNFEGVLCIYICYSMRDKSNAIMLCFLYVKQTNVLQSIVIHESFVCAFSCCIIVSLLIARTLSFMLWLKCYDPSFQCLQILWSSLWWCMSPQKLFFLFITYLLEDEQELSLGMLIHCKCIYNFWCSMLGFIYFLMFSPHFGVLFIWFLGLTY